MHEIVSANFTEHASAIAYDCANCYTVSVDFDGELCECRRQFGNDGKERDWEVSVMHAPLVVAEDGEEETSPIREDIPLASGYTRGTNLCRAHGWRSGEATFEIAWLELLLRVGVSGPARGSSDDGVAPSCPTWAEGCEKPPSAPRDSFAVSMFAPARSQRARSEASRHFGRLAQDR